MRYGVRLRAPMQARASAGCFWEKCREARYETPPQESAKSFILATGKDMGTTGAPHNRLKQNVIGSIVLAEIEHRHDDDDGDELG